MDFLGVGSPERRLGRDPEGPVTSRWGQLVRIGKRTIGLLTLTVSLGVC